MVSFGMNLSDGVIFLLFALLCVVAGFRRSKRKVLSIPPEEKVEKEAPEDHDLLWEAREEHIRRLTVPLEERHEVVGRIGALCSCMSREEMYMVFEYARTVVRTREGFDREVH